MKVEFPTFRRAFVTGLLVITPVVVTTWVFVTVFRFIDARMRPLLLRVPQVEELSLPEWGLGAIGFVTAIVVVILVGLFANNLIGRAVIGLFDRGVARIPWIKAVYSATKDIAGVVFGERSPAFRQVVLFEYPRPGIYALGFVTRELEDIGGGIYNVFLPTTPNPTSGYFLMVPRKDAIQLPISIEDGLKLVVSGGAVLSDENLQRLDEALAPFRS